MATKKEIKERQSYLKKHLISLNRNEISFFTDVLPFYRSAKFISRFGELSESRARKDLTSLGYIYSKERERFISDSVNDVHEIHSQIIQCMYFMTLYKPFSIDLVPCNYDIESNRCQLSSILLHYNRPSERNFSKYNIDTLLKNIKMYYDKVYNNSDLGELNIVITEKYLKFEFLNFEDLNRLYENLEDWKSNQREPGKKRKFIKKYKPLDEE